jgi:hypothetical protein
LYKLSAPYLFIHTYLKAIGMLSKRVLYVVFAILVFSALVAPRWHKDSYNLLFTFDTFGYYVYLPGALKYQDVNTLAWLPDVNAKYQLHGYEGALNNLPNGNKITKYTCGLAVLFAPWYLLADLLAKPLGYPADGFSVPYQAAICIGALVFLFFACCALRAVLKKYFDDTIVAILLFTICLGTNFYHYASFDYGQSHIWLFSLHCFILYYSTNIETFKSAKKLMTLAFLLGLCVLIRPTEILLGLIPLFFAANYLKQTQAYQDLVKKVMASIPFFILPITLQLFYWHHVTDQWVYYSYNEEGFHLLHPHILDGLFSFRKGWLVYTPIAVFGILGIFFSRKHLPQFAVLLITYFVIHIYISFSWHCWWYGGTVGQRQMVQTYPLLAIGIGAFLMEVQSWKIKPFIYTLGLLLCSLNIFSSWQPRLFGIGLDPDGCTKAFFMRMFGNFRPHIDDLKLQDNPYAYTSKNRKNIARLFQSNLDFSNLEEASVQLMENGEKAILVDGSREFSKLYSDKAFQNRWVRVTASYFTDNLYTSLWDVPQLVFEGRFPDNSQPVSVQCKPHRLLDNGKWRQIEYDFRLPLKSNHLEVYFWKPTKSKSSFWVKDIMVEGFD